jgi:hypothetical protein
VRHEGCLATGKGEITLDRALCKEAASGVTGCTTTRYSVGSGIPSSIARNDW